MSNEATIARALEQARAHGVALLDSRLMLGRLLGRTRTELIAHDDEPLAGPVAARWNEWLARRAAGEPLAYLLGEKEFHGLMLEVTPDVLVPRPETELLVDWVGELVAGFGGPVRVVDLGTGSGAIALAIKQAQPRAVVTATDASAAALAVARRNASRLSLEVEFIAASWWRGLDGRSFDIVVANPPYIREDDPALAALRHEPLLALTPGGDGLAALRTIVEGAVPHLGARGWLLLEHGFDQAEAVRALLAAPGADAIETRRDLAGHPRATGARRPAGPP